MTRCDITCSETFSIDEELPDVYQQHSISNATMTSSLVKLDADSPSRFKCDSPHSDLVHRKRDKTYKDKNKKKPTKPRSKES